MASSFLNQSESGGFADPLATSSAGFGDVDPWSETQTPARIASPMGSGVVDPPAGPVNGNGPATEPRAGEYPALSTWIGEFPPRLPSHDLFSIPLCRAADNLYQRTRRLHTIPSSRSSTPRGQKASLC